MDTFMDKLAQKLTAQEMIKANAAADAEEMKKMQMQIDEYRKILDGMQALLDNAQVDGGAINRLVEEGIAKIEQVQADTRGYDRLRESMEDLDEALNARLAATDEKMVSMENNLAAMESKLTTMDEDVHKECVKVYRNVQAVVVEENVKQTDDRDLKVRVLRDELQKILKISTLALIAAAGSIVFQLLVYLNIL